MKQKRVSKIAKGPYARAVVFRGSKAKTKSGLTKDKLYKNKRGKIVSKAASAAGKKKYERIAGWVRAVAAAKKALGITGFIRINGNSAQGRAFYAKAKSIYNSSAFFHS